MEAEAALCHLVNRFPLGPAVNGDPAHGAHQTGLIRTALAGAAAGKLFRFVDNF